MVPNDKPAPSPPSNMSSPFPPPPPVDFCGEPEDPLESCADKAVLGSPCAFCIYRDEDDPESITCCCDLECEAIGDCCLDFGSCCDQIVPDQKNEIRFGEREGGDEAKTGKRESRARRAITGRRRD